MNDVYLSGVLCAIAALAGIYALVHQLKIMCRYTQTPIFFAIPILIGILAWATASYEFFNVAAPLDSAIIGQRIAMVVSWSWLAISLSIKFKSKK